MTRKPTFDTSPSHEAPSTGPRVYELAKEIGKPNREVIASLRDAGVPIKNFLSRVPHAAAAAKPIECNRPTGERAPTSSNSSRATDPAVEPRRKPTHYSHEASQPNVGLACGRWMTPAWAEPEGLPDGVYEEDGGEHYTFARVDLVDCPGCLAYLAEHPETRR